MWIQSVSPVSPFKLQLTVPALQVNIWKFLEPLKLFTEKGRNSYQLALSLIAVF